VPAPTGLLSPWTVPTLTPVATFEFVLLLLVAILGLEVLAKRTGLPPAAALIVGGIALAFVPGIPAFTIDPDPVLVLFLPPLLMDGAYFTAWSDFRHQLGGILSLAVGAVAFTTLVVGLAAHWLVPGLPWAACFALGAVVSPPDAVTAKAVLARVTLPRRLTVLLEGESLLNDAAGLVLFRFAVAAALTGAFSLGGATVAFGVLALGGLAVGAGIGLVWVRLLRTLEDPTRVPSGPGTRGTVPSLSRSGVSRALHRRDDESGTTPLHGIDRVDPPRRRGLDGDRRVGAGHDRVALPPPADDVVLVLWGILTLSYAAPLADRDHPGLPETIGPLLVGGGPRAVGRRQLRRVQIALRSGLGQCGQFIEDGAGGLLLSRGRRSNEHEGERHRK